MDPPCLAKGLPRAENPSTFGQPFSRILDDHPDWDPTPWKRVLRAVYRDEYKFIWASDDRHG